MAKMEMDFNLKTLGQRFQVVYLRLQECLKSKFKTNPKLQVKDLNINSVM